MPVTINQTPVQIYLSVKDGGGTVVHNERYDFGSVSELPVLPEVGQQWNLVVGGTNFGGTEVTDKIITSQLGGSGFATQIHISTKQ